MNSICRSVGWHKSCARGVLATVVSVLVSASFPTAEAAQRYTARSLADLSLEELADLEVISVSKTAERLSDAPAAIYVITHDEIMRSGVTSIPEALRLAPNLHISQYTASRYVAGARGFAGHEQAQNFSNKLLILIDGRSVYSPLYSGVYLDAQDVLMDDVDRIEVISGPGATLWGANAMHGVINIITRPARETTAVLASAAAGNLERNVNARYGHAASERLAYRVYGKAFEREAMELANGSSAEDDWRKVQGGFRLDWSGEHDTFTASGDGYRAMLGQLRNDDVRIVGANALGRWQRRTDRSQLQVQAYYDQTQRAEPNDGVAFVLRTYDLELQQSILFGDSHRLIWGVGGRWHRYDIQNGDITAPTSLGFEPAERTLTMANVFLHDTIALLPSLDLTLGLKAENDPFSSWQWLPDLRLSWRLNDSSTLWAAASRAIRSATPFDHDVVERFQNLVYVRGNPDFEPEQVNAFELGFRGAVSTRLSLSASVFYNVYDDLRTIEPAPVTVLPLRWDNMMEGHTYGVEAWAKWQVTHWWRLAPGMRLLRKKLQFKNGASELLGISQSGNDPRSQALLTSSMDLPGNLTFDVTFRYVDNLPQPALPSYHDLSASVSWQVSQALQVSLSGFNLLDSEHAEYPADMRELIRRSALAQARWQF